MATRHFIACDGATKSVPYLVLILATLLAAVGARPVTDSWNDRSRLATVECLVDHHTLAIDQSVFAETGDKLLINGHYYSDKSPTPALLMAGEYQVMQWLTGWTAAQNPKSFCYFLTLGSSGVAYVLAVWCIYRLATPLQLPIGLRLLLTASFALATLAPVYSRNVSNHILLLGVTACLMLNLSRLAAIVESGKPSPVLVLGVGTLAGFGYTIDLGAGPVILACTGVLVVYRCRSLSTIVLFALAVLPWLGLHHWLNYTVGGVWKPANAVPEYLDWPGSSFNKQNMTGKWAHEHIGHFLVYALAMLFGNHGFIGHNLPLFLTIPALFFLWRRKTKEFPELIYAYCCSCGVWLIYAMTSNNYSGSCLSIRWFVPLLAFGYYVLGVFLREYPQYRLDFLVLSGWGLVLAVVMWIEGPFYGHMVFLYWLWPGLALASWLGCWIWRRRRRLLLQTANATGVPVADAADVFPLSR